MTLCKIMMPQAKSMRSNWSNACAAVAVCVRFQVAKKHPDEGKDLNAIVANTLKAVLTTNKCLKANASIESRSKEEQEHFNFETLNIGE